MRVDEVYRVYKKGCCCTVLFILQSVFLQEAVSQVGPAQNRRSIISRKVAKHATDLLPGGFYGFA